MSVYDLKWEHQWMPSFGEFFLEINEKPLACFQCQRTIFYIPPERRKYPMLSLKICCGKCYPLIINQKMKLGNEMRQYVNKPNFETFAKKAGARYFEYGKAIFRIPMTVENKDDDYVAGISMGPDGEIEVGVINMNCDNFEKSNGLAYSTTDATWLSETLAKLSKYKSD